MHLRFTILLLLGLSAVAAGQITIVGGYQPPRRETRLTNEDVIRMTKAGLVDDVVVGAVKQKPSNFDTSPDALVQLKNQGVSASVIEAMLAASSKAPEAGPASSAAKPAGGESEAQRGAGLPPRDATKVPTAQGLYQKDASGWKLMDKAPTPQLKTKGAWRAALSYGVASVKAICIFKGGTSTNLATSHRPQFLFVAMQSVISMRDVAIVHLQASKNEREAPYASAGAWTGAKLAYRAEDMVDFSLQTNADGSFTVQPAAELQLGEYLLAAGPGCSGWDFTVQR